MTGPTSPSSALPPDPELPNQDLPAQDLPNQDFLDPDLSGHQLGEYRILKRLGRGGMAVVYLAEQSSLRRQVALKVLRRRLAEQPHNIARFHREAQAAAALVHGNIVQIYEVGCRDDVHYIAQEYIAGQNLRQRLKRQGPFDATAGVRVIVQVASALLRAAERGIVHRDIKPENILLAESGEAKVADFGLARVLDGQDNLRLTEVGMTLGTPLYMSPEQLEGSPLDYRSDLYSLGATGYQMFADRPPFVGDSLVSVAYQHARVEPRPLAELRPDLPIELCHIVHRLLAKQPGDRFQSAAELLGALRNLTLDGLEDSFPTGWELEGKAGTTLAARNLEVTQRLGELMKAERPPRDWRRWAAIVVAVSALAFLIGAGVAWRLRPRSQLELGPGHQIVPGHQLVSDRMPTAREQYDYASLVGDEAAWKSVAQFFPPEEGGQNVYYARRAQQRLAELYRELGRRDEAWSIYEQLAELPESATEFRAFGLIGMASLSAEAGRRSEALAILGRARRLLSQLDPPVRRELLGRLDEGLRREAERALRDDIRPRPGIPGSGPGI